MYPYNFLFIRTKTFHHLSLQLLKMRTERHVVRPKSKPIQILGAPLSTPHSPSSAYFDFTMLFCLLLLHNAPLIHRFTSGRDNFVGEYTTGLDWSLGTIAAVPAPCSPLRLPLLQRLRSCRLLSVPLPILDFFASYSTLGVALPSLPTLSCPVFPVGRITRHTAAAAAATPKFPASFPHPL